MRCIHNQSQLRVHVSSRPNPPYQEFSCSSASRRLLLGEEDDKDNEEDDQDEEDLDHQPAVGGDRLEVLEDLRVGRLHVQLGVLHVGVDPAVGRRRPA